MLYIISKLALVSNHQSFYNAAFAMIYSDMWPDDHNMSMYSSMVMFVDSRVSILFSSFDFYRVFSISFLQAFFYTMTNLFISLLLVSSISQTVQYNMFHLIELVVSRSRRDILSQVYYKITFCTENVN